MNSIIGFELINKFNNTIHEKFINYKTLPAKSLYAIKGIV